MQDFYSFDALTIPYWVKTLFWGLYMVVFVYAVWKMLVSTKWIRRQRDFAGLFGLFFAVYAVFYCVNPDYFSYREWLNITNDDDYIKEKVYIYLAQFCRRLHFDYPYELFRLIVWGTGILLVRRICKQYRGQLLPGFTVLLLFVLYAGTFCYARASLAMAVYFFGMACCLTHRRGFMKLLGIAIAVMSIYFHREMLVAVAALPCLFLPFEKRGFSFFSLVLLAAAVFAIKYASSNPEFMDLIYDEEAEISEKIDSINSREQGQFRLSTFVKYVSYFYPFYLITKYIWKRRVPRSIAGIYRIACGILMASVAFMVVSGLRSIYTYRVLYISLIPLTLLTSYGYTHRYITKRQLFLMLLFAVLTNSIRFINAQ